MAIPSLFLLLQGLLDNLGQIDLFGVFLELLIGQDRAHLWVVNESC